MSLYFPQLATGNTAQFPLHKTIERRTVVNRLPDGSEIRLADSNACSVRWQLDYRGLSDAERLSLLGFFDQTQGPLRSFVFLDPSDNLLVFSDEFDQSVWSLDPMLHIQRLDGYAKVTNTAQTIQTIAQATTVPASFRLCGSGVLRAVEPATVTLWMSGSGEQTASAFKIGDDWQTCICSGVPGSALETTRFGIDFSAGAAVELRGLQLEAQPGRSGYHRTKHKAGIYAETRFDQDRIVFRAEGLDDFATSIRLVSAVRL